MSEGRREDEEPLRMRCWSIQCPHLRVRAALDLEVGRHGVRLVDCSIRDFACGRCDERCLRSFQVSKKG